MLEVNSDFTINCRYVKNVHAQIQGQESNWNKHNNIFNTFHFWKMKVLCAVSNHKFHTNSLIQNDRITKSLLHL